MELQQIKEMTNDHGKKFLDSWHFENKEILGVENTKSNILRKEFTIIYRELQGDIYTAILPCAETSNDGCCFFGDIKYFNILFALEQNNIQPKWNPTGYVMWPVWYTSKEELQKFLSTYKELEAKYS